jgi:hypothetical protein
MLASRRVLEIMVVAEVTDTMTVSGSCELQRGDIVCEIDGEAVLGKSGVEIATIIMVRVCRSAKMRLLPPVTLPCVKR